MLFLALVPCLQTKIIVRENGRRGCFKGSGDPRTYTGLAEVVVDLLSLGLRNVHAMTMEPFVAFFALSTKKQLVQIEN